MNQKLTEMTSAELKQYLSDHRKDDEAFSEALQVLMERNQPTKRFPPPHTMSPEEVEAIFREKLNQINQQE